MFNYRITKYNPKLRNDKGFYLRDEWKSVYDIGKLYGDTEFTLHEYLATEELYINIAYCLFRASGKPHLTLKSLEKMDREYHFLEKYNLGYSADDISNLHENMTIDNKQQFINICKMCLREIIWCKLESDSGFYIHFGYDYYMYIGGIQDRRHIENCESKNIFIEIFLSPYTEE